MLQDRILKEIQGVQGEVSIVLKNLNEDRWITKFNENRSFPSASTIKILIMIEALNQVQEGKFTLDQAIKVKESDKVDFSIISDLRIDTYTYMDLITLMIIVSDNTATNILIDLLSYEKINGMGHTLGLSSTVLKRKMMDFEAIKEGRQNETSAIDMGKMMEKIYNKSILSEEMCELMINTLKRQKHKDMLIRYISEDIDIGHKGGELQGLNHDIGIFYLKDIHYILGVFVTDVNENLEAKRIIGKVSKLVYDYYCQGNI